MTRFRIYFGFAIVAAVGHLMWARLQPQNWQADLNSHFLPQELIWIALSIAGFLFTVSRWFSIAFVAVSIAAVSYLIFPDNSFGPSATYDTSKQFQVISFNVNSANVKRREISDWILASVKNDEPTIVLILEMSDAWALALESLKTKLPYSIVKPTNDNFGIAVYSNQPLDQMIIDPFLPNDPNFPVLAADGIWRVLGKEIRFLGIHPPPPVQEAMFNSRNETFKRVNDLVASTEHAVVAGDFNCTPWSKNFELLFATSGLADSDAGLARKHTWAMLGGLITLPIDFVLQKGVRPVSSEVGPHMGSDHRPVKKRFSF